MTFEELAKQPFWIAVPSVLWFVFGVVLLLVLRRQIAQLSFSLVERLKSGAAIKLGGIEVGEIMSVPSASELSKANNHFTVADTGEREKDRSVYYERCRGVMLVHKIFRSNVPDQTYDALVYVIPHGSFSLAGVTSVEYYFGKMWKSRIFASSDRARGFPILVSAYGSFLCAAKVVFNDGESVITHRYIDFEMGAFAPILKHDA
ncbi:MAG: hypothetical protein DWQ37_05660 [Planctomycetota bacterium]|nr:MAG: hypothetical protein DWQ37_05660 [Planctomycetota bacterium]